MTTCDMKYVDNVLDEEQGLKRFKKTPQQYAYVSTLN